jgi:hypothetical protein
MKRYSKVGQTICKAGTDSVLCAAICGPVPEFLWWLLNKQVYNIVWQYWPETHLFSGGVSLVYVTYYMINAKDLFIVKI